MAKGDTQMMAIQLVCKCGKEFIAFQKKAGETIICKKCGAAVVMPDLDNIDESELKKDITGQTKIHLKEASEESKTEKFGSAAAKETSPEKEMEPEAPPEITSNGESREHGISGPPKQRRRRNFGFLSSAKAIIKIIAFLVLLGVLVYVFPYMMKLITTLINNIKF